MVNEMGDYRRRIAHIANHLKSERSPHWEKGYVIAYAHIAHQRPHGVLDYRERRPVEQVEMAYKGRVRPCRHRGNHEAPHMGSIWSGPRRFLTMGLVLSPDLALRWFGPNDLKFLLC